METCRFSVNNKDDKAPTLKGMKPGLHRAVQWEQVELHLVTIQFSLACTKHHPKSWITTSSWEPLSDTKEKRGTARRLCWLWSPKRQQREHIILYAVFAWIQNTMVSLFPASLLWWWEVWRRAEVLLIYSRNIHRTRNLSMESKGIIRILSPPAIAWHMAAPLPTTSITLSLLKKKKKISLETQFLKGKRCGCKLKHWPFAPAVSCPAVHTVHSYCHGACEPIPMGLGTPQSAPKQTETSVCALQSCPAYPGKALNIPVRHSLV